MNCHDEPGGYNRLVTLNYTTGLKPATLYSSHLTENTLNMVMLHNRLHWVAHVGTFLKRRATMVPNSDQRVGL